jgi:hypothetical protein
LDWIVPYFMFVIVELKRGSVCWFYQHMYRIAFSCSQICYIWFNNSVNFYCRKYLLWKLKGNRQVLSLKHT